MNTIKRVAASIGAFFAAIAAVVAGMGVLLLYAALALLPTILMILAAIWLWNHI